MDASAAGKSGSAGFPRLSPVVVTAFLQYLRSLRKDDGISPLLELSAAENHKRKMTEIFGGVVRHLGQKQGQILNGKDVVDLVASKREVFHSVSVNYSYGRTWEYIEDWVADTKDQLLLMEEEDEEEDEGQIMTQAEENDEEKEEMPAASRRPESLLSPIAEEEEIVITTRTSVSTPPAHRDDASSPSNLGELLETEALEGADTLELLSMLGIDGELAVKIKRLLRDERDGGILLEALKAAVLLEIPSIRQPNENLFLNAQLGVGRQQQQQGGEEKADERFTTALSLVEAGLLRIDTGMEEMDGLGGQLASFLERLPPIRGDVADRVRVSQAKVEAATKAEQTLSLQVEECRRSIQDISRSSSALFGSEEPMLLLANGKEAYHKLAQATRELERQREELEVCVAYKHHLDVHIQGIEKRAKEVMAALPEEFRKAVKKSKDIGARLEAHLTVVAEEAEKELLGKLSINNEQIEKREAELKSLGGATGSQAAANALQDILAAHKQAKAQNETSLQRLREDLESHRLDVAQMMERWGSVMVLRQEGGTEEGGGEGKEKDDVVEKNKPWWSFW